MPEIVRRQAIEDAGNAVAEITEMNYDETVQYAAFLAEKNGWILIQDTSWEGYERIPGWIIEGYLTMAAEAVGQMDGKQPTHLFLQAGVGAMAGGIVSYFLSRGKGAEPVITIVEPREAACIYQSVSAGDGKVHPVTGNPVTIMAGLNCGTPCGVVWPVMRDSADRFCACDDSVTKDGMRAYAAPEKDRSESDLRGVWRRHIWPVAENPEIGTASGAVSDRSELGDPADQHGRGYGSGRIQHDNSK